MPRLTDQLQQLGARQQALEERVSAAPAGSTQRPKPAHQMPFFPPKNLTGAGGSASAFASYFGPPPKTGPAKAAAADQAPAHAAVSPEALDPEGADDPQSSSLQGALAQQGSALTLLVNHLIAQASENSGDFGGGAAGSSSLSSKGTARRDRLQAELAEHTGNFMLAVVQMGFRRMYPAGQQPRSLEEVRANPPPFRFQDYIERYGGYGQQRDLGLVAFMVSQIADLLISGEVEGALDSLSLLLVALEQAAQDSGKWEVAYALSMFPDPPSQVFQSRPSPHNARLRAWAPLCPAPWCTTTLAYLKEADAILARRTEALSSASRKTDASDKGGAQKTSSEAQVPQETKAGRPMTCCAAGPSAPFSYESYGSEPGPVLTLRLEPLLRYVLPPPGLPRPPGTGSRCGPQFLFDGKAVPSYTRPPFELRLAPLIWGSSAAASFSLPPGAPRHLHHDSFLNSHRRRALSGFEDAAAPCGFCPSSPGTLPEPRPLKPFRSKGNPVAPPAGPREAGPRARLELLCQC